MDIDVDFSSDFRTSPWTSAMGSVSGCPLTDFVGQRGDFFQAPNVI